MTSEVLNLTSREHHGKRRTAGDQQRCRKFRKGKILSRCSEVVKSTWKVTNFRREYQNRRWTCGLPCKLSQHLWNYMIWRLSVRIQPTFPSARRIFRQSLKAS